MDSIFAPFDDFAYGNVFSEFDSDDAIRKSIGYARSRVKRIIRNVVIIPAVVLSLAAFNMISLSVNVQADDAASNSIHDSSISKEDPSEIRDAFHDARRFLGLSQEEAADALHMAVSSLRKYEHGYVLHPASETLDRYRSLVQLRQVYESAFGSNHEAIQAMLRKPGILFYGKSPLEYASQGPPDAIFHVLSMHGRMLA